MKPEVKGYTFAFAASLVLAASFIFSKAALEQTDIYLFGLTWFGVGAVLNLVWLLWRKRRNIFARFNRASFSLALIIAVLEGVATVSFYLAIQKMENPAVVSFIGNLGPVLVTVMGILILGEKYNRWQIFGIIIALVGVFTVTFNKGTEIKSFFQPGSQYVLFASVLFALATIIARKGKERLDPELMSTIRSILLFFVFTGIIISRQQEVSLGSGTWQYIIIGSLLETLLTIVFAYQALRYLEAAKTSLVISTKAIWLVLMAWIFLDTFPQAYELAGGVLSLLGIGLITLKRRQRSERIYS